MNKVLCRKPAIDQREDGIILVTFIDPYFVDEVMVNDLKDRLDLFISQGKSNMLFNLERIEVLSSSAVGAFIGLSKRAKDAMGKLILYGVSEHNQNIFKLMSLGELLAVSASTDLDAALTEF